MTKEKKRYKYWIRKPIWKLYYEDESVIASDDTEATKNYRSGDCYEWDYSDCVMEREDKPYIISKTELVND